MPPKPPDPERTPVVELIADLRDDANDLAEDLEGIPPHATAYGQAAQTLEEFDRALTQIAEGAPDPRRVAEDALSLSASLKPAGSADDTIRDLLKPKRT